MPPIPLISAHELTKNFGSGALFDKITFALNEGERIALIGPNGSGKSTLLRMLAGLEHPDSGAVRPRRGLHCAYVAQEDKFDDSLSVREILEQAIAQSGAALHGSERQLSVVMGTVGFRDPSAKVGSFSGGWRKRLAIARALVQEPELLLLDEPTNHLDIDGVLWLEELLSKARCGVVFVSHDRYFIERLAQRVIEIDKRFPQGFFSQQGTYADFLEKRAEFLAGLHQSQESLANRVRREVEWLRQGAKARTTKSKHRSAEALRMVDELKGINLEKRDARLEFSSSARKTKDLIKVENASKSMGGHELFKDISLLISPGVRLGIVGPNGSGKTTFVRMLLGEIEPDKGRVARAPQLRFAFFDQARKQLDKSVTLKTALCRDGDSVTFNGRLIHVSGWARRFLFSNHQLSLNVGSLSGGEQARVLLAKIMLEEADVIFFDEPTNDLDIATLEVLEDAFCDFPGAIVLVTHDRYLLDRTSTTVLAISGETSGIYGDYIQWENARLEESQAQGASSGGKATGPVTPFSQLDQKELDGIEKKILKAEEAVAKIQEQLSDPKISENAKTLTEYCDKLAAQQEVVDGLYARWEDLEEKKKLARSE